jgi:hypothetical protein
MNKITALLDNLDFSRLVPDLDALLSKIPTVAIVAVMTGPLILLALGLLYLFAPPKEANHKAGFRTYFGMGSIPAWRFTQRVAGVGMGGLGLILTIVMGIICMGFKNKEAVQLLETAMTCLIWEAILAAVAYLAITVIVTVTFDKYGSRRR